MIKRICLTCKKPFETYPCRVRIGIGKYCSRDCYAPTRSVELAKRGENSRFQPGHKSDPLAVERSRIANTGAGNKKWKGQFVGYRGLHYWVVRHLGKPTKCSQCGAEKTGPKSIQWANVDGKYRRDLTQFVQLCSSCHKKHDIALKG